MRPNATVVMPRRADEDRYAFEACPMDSAELFSVYIEDETGVLHMPEEFGVLGNWDFTDFREADIAAAWLNTGLITHGATQ